MFYFIFLFFTNFRYYENVAIASSTTSTRKSSHYQQRNRQQAPPYSPSIKSDAVSYIYDQNSNRAQERAAAAAAGLAGRLHGSVYQQAVAIVDTGLPSGASTQRSHNIVAQQDSTVSTAMLLKQDSTASAATITSIASMATTSASMTTTTTTATATAATDAAAAAAANSSQGRQCLLKQDSSSSRQMLIKQESSDATSMGTGSSSVSRQDSNASLFGGSIGGGGYGGGSGSCNSSSSGNFVRHTMRHQDSGNSKHALLSKQDSVVSYIEAKRGQLMRQDSDLSNRRRAGSASSGGGGGSAGAESLCKQDTQVSFVNGSSDSDGGLALVGRRTALCRQDSVVSFGETRGMCFCCCVIPP